MFKLLRRGFPGALSYFESRAEVVLDGTWSLTFREANKVLEAKSVCPPREIEILEGGPADIWDFRTVNILPAPPAVVVKAKGMISNLRSSTSQVWLPHPGGGDGVAHHVENIREAARAYADKMTIEIVSIGGGPDMVRLVEK